MYKSTGSAFTGSECTVIVSTGSAITGAGAGGTGSSGAHLQESLHWQIFFTWRLIGKLGPNLIRDVNNMAPIWHGSLPFLLGIFHPFFSPGMVHGDFTMS